MGYYSDLLLRAYEAVGADRADGIMDSDPILTAYGIERAERMAAYSAAECKRVYWRNGADAAYHYARYYASSDAEARRLVTDALPDK